MIENERIRRLNERPDRDGAYVLYWMQQSQRAGFNQALELAAGCANDRRLPLVAGFGLMDDYPEANARHYAFMLQGLREVASALAARGIAFVIRRGAPDAVALDLAADAAIVVCDAGYLRHQRAWRQRLGDEAACPVIRVEADVVVPVGLVSARHEYAARTIRPKILRHRDRFLRPLETCDLVRDAGSVQLESDIDLSDVAAALATSKLDRTVGPVGRLTGGASEARRRLAAFLDDGLAGYADGRNQPADWRCSFMSPYLHFGQISPVELALAVRESGSGGDEDRAAYLEELVVRRELSMNNVVYNPAYDRYDGLPEWARRTLGAHAGDARDHIYDIDALARGETHDRYWNAAMREMTATGFMHNCMRMYWGKKILEWSPDPETAFRTALTLNNRYFIDGRDANSYTNVSWCFGMHDRAWTERPIFGKIRYMSAGGLERKFDIGRYIDAVDRLAAAEARGDEVAPPV
ncbi:MAG: deoxyribodipyrimidine photo-lyase [Rhodospirillales bacterium]|nr:deoxyribodipyrimidine photo-lyase [Rhodospirillales bacterium]